MNNEIERAEFNQSLKAFLIPASLFIATLTSACGAFLVFTGYAFGWLFLCVSGAVITIALAAFARFQNKLRAAGQFRQDASCKSSRVPDISQERNDTNQLDSTLSQRQSM